MIKKIFITVAGILLILNSCNSNPVIPPEDEPGRRNYTWTVDTVNYPDGIYRLWGSSPSDLWAVSGGGNLYTTIWHFDGEKWSTDNVFRRYAPQSVFGFSKDIVFMGGSLGRIWQLDVSNWKEATALTEVAALTINEESRIVFDNMWGESPNDFYAFGAYPDKNGLANNPVIVHYINNNWVMLNTSGVKGIVEQLYKNKTDKKIYLLVVEGGNGEYPDSTHIFELVERVFTQTKYYKLYSSVWTKGLQADISLINGEVYFILGYEIAKRVNNKFQTFLKIDNYNFYGRIWGRNPKDIFLRMTDGLVHYNGTDMQYLIRFNKLPTAIYGAVLFDDEVFFLVYEAQTNFSLIYHGKLNNKGG